MFFAPADVQIARVDRQCVVYACDALQRIGIDVELVAMKVRLVSSELRSENPLSLYRLRSEPKLRQVRSLAGQNSSSFWSAANRLLIHTYAALAYRRSSNPAQKLVFYTKNYSSARVFLGMKSWLMPRLKVIFEAHTLPKNGFQTQVLKSVDGIVANSLALEQDLLPLVPTKPMLGIHQGVDLDCYNAHRISKQEARQQVGLPIGAKLAVYTGKVYWKYEEVELLLQSAQLLDPGLELLVVGGRADHARRYQEHVRERGLRNVRMVSFVPPREVQTYQLAADVLVSYYPPGLELNQYRSPGKLFEYMAAGRAIVAADYASLREVIDESSAVFVKPGSPQELAAALNSLLRDNDRGDAMGRAALKQVEQFTWEKRAQRICQFIETLN